MTNEASVLVDTDADNKADRRRQALAGARLRRMSARPMSPPRSRSGTRIRRRGREAAAGREGHPGPRLHLHGRKRQCGRSLAGIAARPRLRQCPPAAGLDPQPRPHDPALGGLGGAGTGRAFRCTAACCSRKTEGSTPFRFSLHVGDVGHTLVVGPTGAGKSVLLALMALQFRRYPRSQVFAFDFGGVDPGGRARHGRRLARSRRLRSVDDEERAPTLASPLTAAQPLDRIDAAGARAGPPNGSSTSSPARGSTMTPEVKEHLWSALTSLASAPVGERTLTGLSVLLQSQSLKRALATLLPGRSLRPAARCRGRAARRGVGSGVRDRRV